MTLVRKRDRSLLSNAVSLILCGLLAGLVVAAAAFPAIAMSGLAAKGGADAFDKLPSDIVVQPAPQISYVYASDGKTLLAQLYDEYRLNVKLDQVAQVMQDAMVAAEDVRFYQHNGVDVKGAARAFVANQQGSKVSQGGSTLTMQYVRQAISYSARTPAEVVAATEQTPTRKLREMKYAIALEKKITKKQILENYLNIAPFGHSAYGIYAAAHVYFNKDPKDLTLGQSALLASLVKAPTTFDPTTETGLPQAMARRDYVLGKMVEMKAITAAQRDEAVKEKVEIYGKRAPRDCIEPTHPELGAGFFCDYLVRWWLQQPAFGDEPYVREQALRTAGYTITTSLDITTQQAAWAQAQHQSGDVGKGEQIPFRSRLAVMLAAIEPGTGKVQALATNRNFSNDQSQNGPNSNPQKKGQKGNWPNTTVPFITGGPDVPGYQAGSSFKIFTALAAMEKGFPLSYTINAEETAKTKFPVGRDSPAACPGTPYYCPSNDNKGMIGQHNMWGAFGMSVNTYFVPLEEQAGAQNAVDVAKRLGIGFRGDPKDTNSDAFRASKPEIAASWGAFTLGVSATTPLELANAYATLAADGTYCPPTPVNDIQDRDGKKVTGWEPKCNRALDPDVARGGIDIARCPVGDHSPTSQCETGTARYVRGIVGLPTAGKTGTTDNMKDATFVATTKTLAVAGFLTDPDDPEHNEGMKHPPINNAVAYTLKAGSANRPKSDFTPPSQKIINGNQVGVPDVHCQSVGAAVRAVRGAGFSASVSNNQVQSDCPAGQAAGTSPSGKAPKGANVTILVSKGGGPGGPQPPDQGRPGRGGGPGVQPGQAPTDCILCPGRPF